MTAVVETPATVGSVAELLGSNVNSGLQVRAVLDSGLVLGWLVVEPGAQFGDVRRCAIISDSSAVVAVGPITDVRISVDDSPTDRVMPVWVHSLAWAVWGVTDMRAQRDAAIARVQANEARLEQIVDAAHKYADDNSLCEEFDRFMLGQGLRPREQDWTCVVDVTVRVRIGSRGYSAEAAEAKLDRAMTLEALSQLQDAALDVAIQERCVIEVEPG